jgi:hypothetical protein
LRRLWRFLVWFVVVDALITTFSVTTGPLLLSLAVDSVVVLLIIRSCSELRAAMLVAKRPVRALVQLRWVSMLGLVLSQLALRVLSTVLGGYGIFCLIMSFTVPRLGAQAFILLGTASVIVHFCRSERA